jgi:hypothetical protein
MEATEISDLWLGHHEAKVRAGVRAGVPSAPAVVAAAFCHSFTVREPHQKNERRSYLPSLLLDVLWLLVAIGSCSVVVVVVVGGIAPPQLRLTTPVFFPFILFCCCRSSTTLPCLLANDDDDDARRRRQNFRRSAWWACASRATRGPRCWSGPRSGTVCDCRCWTDSTVDERTVRELQPTATLLLSCPLSHARLFCLFLARLRVFPHVQPMRRLPSTDRSIHPSQPVLRAAHLSRRRTCSASGGGSWVVLCRAVVVVVAAPVSRAVCSILCVCLAHRPPPSF